MSIHNLHICVIDVEAYMLHAHSAALSTGNKTKTFDYSKVIPGIIKRDTTRPILLLCGKTFHSYRNDIYAILSAGNNNEGTLPLFLQHG